MKKWLNLGRYTSWINQIFSLNWVWFCISSRNSNSNDWSEEILIVSIVSTNYIRSGKGYLSHFHPYEEEVYQSLVFLLHLAIRVSRVVLRKKKKGEKEKEAKQKMRTSLEHVETEFQLGWPHDTTLCLTWWFNVLWAFLGIDGLTSSIRVTSLEQLSVVEFSGE